MAWPNIDPTSPASTDKVKFGDDVIRSFKSNMITALQKICNFQDNAGTTPALKTAVWTTATRPTGGDLVDKVTGYNTDLGYEEYYDLASASWIQKALPILSSWAVTGRPSSPYTGQYGYNTDLAIVERWNGSAWARVSGGNRGDVKQWYGTYADAESSNPGWKLFNGQTFTHPEGGSVTLPDIRDKFPIAAGNLYAVGATGGEATHTLTTDEMPNHYHNINAQSSLQGANNALLNAGNTEYGISDTDLQRKYQDYLTQQGFTQQDISNLLQYFNVGKNPTQTQTSNDGGSGAGEFVGTIGSALITCFAAGTMIKAAEKDIAIEEIKIGDVVSGRNGEGLQVIRIMQPVMQVVYMVRAGSNLVVTTASQEFVTPEGIKLLAQLKAGDEVITADGIMKIDSIETVGRTIVYDFATDGANIYYAGGFLVEGGF